MVINYGEGGGATKREGGGVKFYPYRKKCVGGGGGHAEWGGGRHKMCVVVLTQELDVHPLKRGTQKVLPCLDWGGGEKKFRPTISPLAPPPLRN